MIGQNQEKISTWYAGMDPSNNQHLNFTIASINYKWENNSPTKLY